MGRLYLAVFAGEFALALLLVRAAMPLAHRLGYMDRPGLRKAQKAPVPYGGGVAVAATMVLLHLALLLAWTGGLLDRFPQADWATLFTDRRVLCLLGGGAGMFLLGLVDDLHDLRPRTKLAVQAAVTCLAVAVGPKMSFFAPYPWVAFLGTCLWVVLITNAFNLLDNMDGLCASVALVCLGVHFLFLAGRGQHLVALFTVVLAAPLLAFLVFNAPPARIYLGDAGSLLVGFAVSQLSVMSTYYRDGQLVASIAMPLLILAIPLYDTATVIAIRVRIGQSIFQADRNHFSHRLLALGLSTREVLAVTLALGLAMGLGALQLADADEAEAALVFVQAVLILLAVLVLETAGRRKGGP